MPRSRPTNRIKRTVRPALRNSIVRESVSVDIEFVVLFVFFNRQTETEHNGRM